MAKTLDEIKQLISRDFNITEYQRTKANEDMRFGNIDGGMWEGFLTSTHNTNSGRARLELDIVSDYVERFIGEWTLNRANVTFTPSDDATTDDDAEMLNGIYRADFKDFSGQVSQDNAVKEAAYCGVGAFLLRPQFDDEGDPENDKQHEEWKPIYNAYNQVIWDGNAKNAAKDDARRCTILWTFTEDAFLEEFPGKAPVSAYTPFNRQWLNQDWRTNKLIYIAEYYEVEFEKTTIEIWGNADTGQLERINQEDVDRVRSDLEGMGFVKKRERKVRKRRVYRTVISGEEVLEERKRIAGAWIPVIPVYAYRQYIDGREYSRGLVRKLKDAQRLFNSNISRMAETAASSPDTKPIFTRTQIEGLEHLWKDMTNKSYGVINDLEDADGNIQAAAPIGYIQSTQVDPNTIASTQLVADFVQRQTGNAPQDTIDPDASGKAINALRKRENLNTQTFSDNIVQSLKHSGVVWRSQAAEVYISQRIKRTLALDGEAGIVKIFETAMDESTGMLKHINRPDKGSFQVDVEVGPQYESQREATIESIEAVMKNLTEDSPFFMPLLSMWINNIVGTGLEPLKEFNRNQMLSLGLVEPADDEEKEMLQKQQEEAADDPNADLVRAAAAKEQSEVVENASIAERNKAVASTEEMKQEKLRAEAMEIMNGIGQENLQALLDLVQRLDESNNAAVATGQPGAAGVTPSSVAPSQSVPSSTTLQ